MNELPANKEIIKAEALSKSFEGVKAVENLTLSVVEGEIFGLVGPDGAGKTTSMRLLTSIMEPSSGQAWIAGFHLVKEAEAVKENIGYMSQKFGLYPDLTVMENIDFYADIYSVAHRGREEKINQLLKFSNLAAFKKRKAGKLSGGMKQKLALACTLIHTPKVLFLDEPTNGVDPVSRREFWRILYQLQREKVTIFLSTAYLDEAERCSRIGLIHQGQLLSVGTPKEIKKLMNKTILELRTPKPREAASWLRHSFEQDSADVTVSLFGDRLHLITYDSAKTTDQAKALFERHCFELSSIKAIEPSLEDVFVAMLSKEIEPNL